MPRRPAHIVQAPETFERVAFSIKEVANQLGVHPATVKRSIARGHLQTAKILGRTLILRQDRDEWLTRQTERVRK